MANHEKPILLMDVLKKNGEEHHYDEIMRLIMSERGEEDYDEEDEDEYYDDEEEVYYDVEEHDNPPVICDEGNVDEFYQTVATVQEDAPISPPPSSTLVLHPDTMTTGGPKEFVLLQDILTKNGEEYLYDQIMDLSKTADEGPPIIFAWKNVENFVRVINATQTGVPAPPPPPPSLLLTPNMTVGDFKVALLNYAKITGAANPLGTTVLPCALDQFAQSTSRLTILDLHPWTQHIIAQGTSTGEKDILPLATIWVPDSRPGTLFNAMEAHPNSLWE